MISMFLFLHLCFQEAWVVFWRNLECWKGGVGESEGRGGSAQFFKLGTFRGGGGHFFSYGELANFLDMQNTDQFYIELSIKCCFFFSFTSL